MELKKNPVHDVHRYRAALFGVGLIVSIALTLMAFQWKTEVKEIIVCKPDPVEDISYQIPITDFEEPPKPKAIQHIPVTLPIDPIVDEGPSEPISFNVNPIHDPLPEPPEVLLPPEPIDVIVDFASESPEPVGGYKAMYDYLGKNIKYPRRAIASEIEGKVFIKFVVERDGTVSQLEVVKGIGGGCDEEAARVVKNLLWKPGKQGHRTVRVRMILPVIFQLPN